MSLKRSENEDEEQEEDLKLAEQEQELPAEVEEKRRKGMLKTGYTTGTLQLLLQREHFQL